MLKPIKEISQEELNAGLSVSTHLQGLQLQKIIHEIRTSGGHNKCSFPSLGTTQQNLCTNVHTSYASR